MRILTWNLERGVHHGRRVVDQQQAILAGYNADLIVLTEVPAQLSTRQMSAVLSPVRREGNRGMEAWVSITAVNCRPVDPLVPFERMAVAARAVVNGEAIVVYGSVLPWLSAGHHAPYLHTSETETAAELFARILREQVDDMANLRARWPDHTLIWAGDFNQTLSGPNYGGSNARRHLLQAALDELDLVAWNQDAAHAKPSMHAVDLICGPANRTRRKVTKFGPSLGAHTLSDHAGYVVEI